MSAVTGGDEADAAQVTQEAHDPQARNSDGVHESNEPPKPKSPPPTELAYGLSGIAMLLVFMFLAYFSVNDRKSGLATVHVMFDEPFGRHIASLWWVLLLVGIFTAAVLYYELARKRDKFSFFPIFLILTMMGLSAAFGYLISVGLQTYNQASDWQDTAYPASDAEEIVKATYDLTYCVRVGRKTCKDMSLQDAAPLFIANLTQWTTTSSYGSLNELCDANPGNDLVICRSCDAIRKCTCVDGRVNTWVAKWGSYDDGVAWCGSYFGVSNESAEALQFAPYNYKREWFLKRVAKSAIVYIGTCVAGILLALIIMVSISIININEWREKNKEATDKYVEHVDA